MILDTSYLIKLFDGHPGAHEKARELHDERELQRVPAPVFTEIEYGAEYELEEDERRRIRNVSRMYSVTRLDEKMARRAGQLCAQADKEQGGSSGADAIDAMVAAVAETAGETVITENVTDFRQLGVGVESF
ncbi:nuclease [Halobacteriales archaeon QS_4_69_225]|nr:MAG: nuclease [Halobacteriales archaeon QS_4_69_225]